MSDFASRVLDRRIALKLNQTQLGKLCGLNQTDISKIEKGLVKETPKILRLARALNCSPDWLEAGKGLLSDMQAQSTSLWPFEGVDQARWERLTERQKGEVESAIKQALDKIEAEPRMANGTSNS